MLNLQPKPWFDLYPDKSRTIYCEIRALHARYQQVMNYIISSIHLIGHHEPLQIHNLLAISNVRCKLKYSFMQWHKWGWPWQVPQMSVAFHHQPCPSGLVWHLGWWRGERWQWLGQLTPKTGRAKWNLQHHTRLTPQQVLEVYIGRLSLG